jgi:hypothetical protein
MSIAQSPSEESDEIHGPGRPKPIRLSEIGQIAAERLDSDDPLQEAVALRPSSGSPVTERKIANGGEAEPAASEIEGTIARTASPEALPADAGAAEQTPVNGSEPAQAIEPSPETVEAAPLSPVPANDHDILQPGTEAVLARGATQAPERESEATVDGAEAAFAAASAGATEVTAIAMEIETEVQRANALTDGQPSGAATVADPAGAVAGTETPPFVAPPLFPTGPTQSIPTFADTHGAVRPLEGAPPETAGDEHHSGSSGAAASSAATEAVHAQAADPNFASALGAAAKLAADANAAASALENLKRLLERQLPNPSQAPRQSVHELFGDPAAATAPPPLSPQEIARRMQDDELPATTAKSHPRPGGRSAAPHERQPFDVRGFMAGFALSWALGAALYIYLTAG